MAECDSLALAAANPCFNSLMPGQQQAAIFNLFCNLLQVLDPMADCDAFELAAANPCFNALSPGQQRAAMFTMECNIFHVISNLGSTCCYDYAGDPNGHVDAPIPAFCVDTANPGRIWSKVADDGGNTGWAANG